MHLVILSGFNNATGITRELKSMKVDFSIETMRNALKEARLGSFTKASKSILSIKSIKARVEFIQLHTN